MDKNTVIELCASMSKNGIYAMPVYSKGYGDWEVKIGNVHTPKIDQDFISLICEVYDLYFLDMSWNKHFHNDCMFFYRKVSG